MKNYVLITGASGGIGFCFAKVFAEKGYNLILVARSKDKLDSIKKELKQIILLLLIFTILILLLVWLFKKFMITLKESL